MITIVARRDEGLSDRYVQQNVFTPGGTSDWHTHSGPSLIIVTPGAVTVYEGDDPACAPRVYDASQETGFVDVGGDVHVIRNEGAVDAQTIVVQLITTGATKDRRPRPRQLPVLSIEGSGGWALARFREVPVSRVRALTKAGPSGGPIALMI